MCMCFLFFFVVLNYKMNKNFTLLLGHHFVYLKPELKAYNKGFSKKQKRADTARGVILMTTIGTKMILSQGYDQK